VAGSPIDLRSDTVTRPSAAMRRAMAEAEVGDDVYGEDPTVNRLQEVVADLLGTEAALYVPSGSMANQIAIRIHTRPGDEALAGRAAHSYLYESGAAAGLSGVQMTLLDGDGRFTGAEVRAAWKGKDHNRPPTSLVMVENTHNAGGGLVWTRAALDGVLAACRDLGLRAHLDGARLWSAAVASGQSERQLAAGFDSVSVCLSKGLGAPVGSLIAGSRDLIHQAHRARKMMGGGMRQAGVLAAAGLHALEHNRARLAEDHENAALIARGLEGAPGLTAAPAESNILMVDFASRTGEEAQRLAAERGLLFWSWGGPRIRLVTHLDVSRADCQRAVEILAAIA
jgi:threonine aldolase